MRIFKCALAAYVLLCLGQCAITNAQEPSSDLVKVFKPGHDVTSPQPLPTDFSQAITADCPVKLSGTADLALIVAADGTPKNILFLRFTGTDLDRLAVRLLSDQRFTPGTHDGSRVAVSQAVKMKLDGCLVISADRNGQKHVVVRLSRAPEEVFSDYSGYPGEVIFSRPATSSDADVHRIEAGITPPFATNAPKTEFPPHTKRVNGICLIGLIVDVNGLPQDPHVVRSLSPAYDAQALDAVNLYRFKPAIKDAREPVPVMITVEVKFKIYKGLW